MCFTASDDDRTIMTAGRIVKADGSMTFDDLERLRTQLTDSAARLLDGTSVMKQAS